MRKILSVLLTLCMLMSTVAVFPISISAEDNPTSGTCGSNLTWKYDEYTGDLTISGTGAMTNWTSSSNVPWYSFRKSIKTVVIGNSVTSISDDAFRSCSSLIAVTIGNSVKSIGSCAFEDCTSLTKVTVPDSVTSIGDYAFSGCTNLSSATIGNSVKTIGNYSFYNSTNLTEINYKAESVADFTSSSSVFYNAGTSGEGIKVTFGDDVKKIPAYLFYVYDSFYSPKITNVTIGSSVESIGNNAFSDCSNLTSVNITDIKAWCKIRFTSSFSNPLHFAHKLYLNGELVTNLVIPDSVTSIGESAFYQCTSLSSVTIGNSVASIGNFAFWDCKNLTKVTIGNSVTSIGNFAFLNCDKLTISCYPGSYAQTYAINNNIPYVLIADITSLSIKSLPAKTVYPIYGTLKTDGLVLEATLDDGTSCDITSGFTVSDYDFSTPGEKVITVTFMDLSTTFTVTVDADLVEYPESAHPYSENSNETWTYTHKTAAESLEITFSSDTETESGWDYIYIYDKDGNEIGCYSGTQLAGQTVTVPGNSFSIKLTSDGSSQYYGFAIDNIKASCVPQEAKRGDLNGDGKINASDMAILKKVIVGKAEKVDAADVDGDGKVTASDAVLLKKIIVGKA